MTTSGTTVGFIEGADVRRRRVLPQAAGSFALRARFRVPASTCDNVLRRGGCDRTRKPGAWVVEIEGPSPGVATVSRGEQAAAGITAGSGAARGVLKRLWSRRE